MATKIFELPQLKAEVILTQEYTDTNLVVAGGRAPQIDWLKEAASDKKVYCADKGIEVCMEADIIPEELYGDGDSADAQLYWQTSALGTKVRTFPTAKDDTDLQLLLQNLPAGDVICSGVWGGRFDHLYSNVFSLLAVKEKIKNKVILADEKEVMLLLTGDEAVKISLKKNVKALSLLPLSDSTRVTLENVRWQLQEAELKLLHPYAISNIPEKEFTCSCLAGKLGLYLCFEE
ncbi:MAG: thiamine diphosphokinase [Phascolarctobacterium sp.]|nr:thiamine diphosphokinase [Phascolarctobacterium sp.]